MASRKPETGLLHHSDRGSPYASDDYRAGLARHGFVASKRMTQIQGIRAADRVVTKNGAGRKLRGHAEASEEAGMGEACCGLGGERRKRR